MTKIKTPPASPGETLGYELFRRGMTQSDAARLLAVNPAVIGHCVRGINTLSTSLAYRLELAGVGTALQWLAWQAEYDLYTASLLDYSGVKPFPPVYTPPDKEQLALNMKQITADNFHSVLVNAFHVPTDLTTDQRAKPFVMFTDGGRVMVAKPDGKRRIITPKEARAFFEQYQATGSTTPSHYHEASFNTSYLLAALKHVQNAA